MRIAWRGLRAVTVGLVSAVVLAGCSGNSTKPTVLPSLHSTTPNATPSAAPAATSTAAVTTAAPTTTKPIVSTDPLAAPSLAISNAVREYFAAANASIHDPSSEAGWKSKFTISCEQCATDYRNISKFHTEGKHAKGGGYRILKITSQAVDGNSGGSTVTFSTESDTIYDNKGKVLERDPAQPKQGAGLTLNRAGNRWLVVGWIDFGKIT